MARRARMSRRSSRRTFRRGAKRVRSVNMKNNYYLRGGIRL